MNAFSEQWLSLRENADDRARDRGLRDAVGQTFAGKSEMRIVDLACGAGANLRGLAPVLPARQHWLLVDCDRALLVDARKRLAQWADSVEHDDPLVVTRQRRRIEITFLQADLAADLACLAPPLDLVACSAFFDLVSTAWIDRLCADLARKNLPLYACLTYSGEQDWRPPHPLDGEVLRAFHLHQASDKGFGRAAGPDGGEVLRKALEARAFDVVTAPSPWRLGAGDARLIRSLAGSIAQAVTQTALAPAENIEAWRQARQEASGCDIGHVDLFARPGEFPVT